MNEKELVLAGVDVKDMLDRFLNNKALIRIIVGKFINDQTFDQLQAAIAQGDMKQAEFACHTLKGMAGNMSLKILFSMLQEQLRLFRAGEHEEAVAMMDGITEEYEKAVSHLRAWVSESCT